MTNPLPELKTDTLLSELDKDRESYRKVARAGANPHNLEA